MIRRTVLFVTALLLFLGFGSEKPFPFTGTSVVHAQQVLLPLPFTPSFPGCQNCGVSMWVDIPAQSSTVSRADLLAGRAMFEGWGFEHVSGHPLDRIEFFVEGNDGFWKPVKQTQDLWVGYYRPDVQNAFPGFPVGDAGWAQPIDNIPDWALGARRWQIWGWRGPYSQGIMLTLNITQ